MLETAIAGAVAGYAIAIPVGAIAVLILHVAITQGFRPAAAAGLGVASADGIYATIAVLAGGALSGVISQYSAALRLVGGLFLIALAIRGLLLLRSTHDPSAAQVRTARHSVGRTYVTFLGLTLINPVTIIYFAALMVGLPSVSAAPERPVFAIAAFLASASWQVLLAGFGTLVGHAAGHRGRLISAVVGNLIVLGFGLVILGQFVTVSSPV
jgi:arginine exporter protein ArgO